MKLKKVNTLKEEKSNNEIAFEEQEKFKKNREDVIKSRTPDKVEKTGDIENAIKNSKNILNTKVPAVKAKKNDFSILESLLKEGFDFDVKSRAFTVNVVDRTSLKKLCECLQKINAKCTINRSVKEGYRYCVTIKETKVLKESKALKEAVSEDAYEIAEIMNSKFENVGKRIYSRNEFDEMFDEALKEYFGEEKAAEILSDGFVFNNNEEYELTEFEDGDVRGILNTYGWATIYEGDYEGGITNYEEFGEDSYANEIIKIINDEPWFKERYPDVRDFIVELVEGHNVDDTMTLGEFNDLLNSDFAKEFLGESLKEEKQVKEAMTEKKWRDIANELIDLMVEADGPKYTVNWLRQSGLSDDDLLELGFRDWLKDENKNESLKEDKKKVYYVVYKDENGVETVQEDENGNTEFEDKDYADDMCTGFSERDTDAKGEYIVKSKDTNESLKEAKGIEHNPEEEKKFVGLDECDKSVKEDICPECGKEPCVCGPATDKDAEYQKTFAKGEEEHDKEVKKELTGKGLDEDLKLLVDISEYKPWAGAVDLWNEIVDADKVEELEFALEDLYPDGLTITDLNDLLWFEQDFVREQIGLAKSAEDDDTVEESFEEKRQRIKESFDK